MSSHFSQVESSGARPCHWTKTWRVGGDIEGSSCDDRIAKGSRTGWLSIMFGGNGDTGRSRWSWWGRKREQWNTGCSLELGGN